MGFHAPQEAVRILGRAIDFARIGLAATYGEELLETDLALLPAPEQTVSPGREPGGDGGKP